MGTERGPEFYDAAYRGSPRYSTPATDSPWAQLHYWLLGQLGGGMVIDLGCGVGHLAELLAARGHDPGRYIGVDFSGEAISQARRRVPSFRFQQGDVLTTARSLRCYDGATVVLCEVLEHVTHDLPVLRSLPTGTRVIATVPGHDSEGHVRHFETMAIVAKRYEHALKLHTLVRLGRCYGFQGVRS